MTEENEIKNKDLALQSSNVTDAETDVDDSEKDQKFGFWQASAFNTMMMFGTGPFITIPYCINSVDPAGSHALLGYGIALVACFCDALVCGEIGSMWPYSGGSATYLRNLYGAKSTGQLVCFLFVFQFLVAGPAEVASGFIAIAEYIVYFKQDIVEWQRIVISLAGLFVATFLLYRNVKEVGWVTLLLAGITVTAVLASIFAGFASFDLDNLKAPPGAFSGGTNKLLLNLAAATRFGVYDMTGYYDVCFMGDEIVNPKRNIPLTCITVCGVIGVIYLIVYISVLGHLGWEQFLEVYTDDYDGDGVAIGIMSVFWESITGSVAFAGFFTIIVCITIFGSVFSMMIGFTHLLSGISKDGYFFKVFARRHEKLDIPHVALLSIAGLSAIWCFFSLDTVIDAMTTLLVLVQFMGQSAGLLYYRYTVPVEEQEEGWRMPLFPLPVIIQFVLFFFIFISSPSRWIWETSDGAPILELSVLFVLLGCFLFLGRAKKLQTWPFQIEDDDEKQYAAGENEE